MHHLTPVKIAVLPLEWGRPVTKSMAMWDYGWRETGREQRRPLWDWVERLDWAETGDSCDVLLDILQQVWPPKALELEAGAGDSRMTGKLRSMAPLQDPGQERFRYVQQAIWTGGRSWGVVQ